MRLNSMQREEPYQCLTFRDNSWRHEVRKGPIQVVHVCRQLVSFDVGLSPATSATPVLCCQRVMAGTHRRLPGSTRRKVGMTSNHHAPYVLGFTHATMAEIGRASGRERLEDEVGDVRLYKRKR